MNKLREIGGGKWISSAEIEKINRTESSDEFVLIASDEIHLSTCRSGLRLIAEESTSKKILIPSYTCSTVIEPFVENGWQVIPYSIQGNLMIDWKDLKIKVDTIQPSAVLFHSYFGFDTVNDNPKYINKLKEQGICIINDLTCIMLSSFDRLKSDYQIGSIRKWLPVPDGAVFRGPLTTGRLEEDTELVMAKMKAFMSKSDYLAKGEGDKAAFLKSFSVAEKILDSRRKPYRMSSLSKAIFNHKDLKQIADRRRSNYAVLYKRIVKYKALYLPFGLPGERVVPDYLPVMVENRRELQAYLAGKNIYATVLWTMPEKFRYTLSDKDAQLYNTILCFPIDQNYDKADMDYMGDVIDRYFKN